MSGQPLIAFHPGPADPGMPRPFEIEVMAGELVLLTGPPGAGQSLILEALRGGFIPAVASASLGGSDFSRLGHRRRRLKARELRLAWLPAEPALISNVTVMENLLLPLRYFGEMSDEKAAREAFILLHASGLGWASALLPSSLSPEDRKTVAIFRGLLRRPKVALMDDPLGGLDAASLAGVRPLLKATIARGECAILATAPDVGAYAGMKYRTVAIAAGWIDGRVHLVP